ncbi:MAG: TPM domain-containing protein [Spirochaetales bacterium]|nr:TPM domain-containing protein [Spirochaetales bacterium]
MLPMLRLKKNVCSVLVLGAIAFAGKLPAQTDPVKPLYVEDFTGSLTEADLARLTKELAQKESEQKISIKVVLLESESEPAETAAERLLQQWRAGREAEESIVLVLFKKESRALIAATYSLEHLLPAGQRTRLLRLYVLPELKQGQTLKAIDQGLFWMDRILNGQRIQEREWEQPAWLFFLRFWPDLFTLLKAFIFILGSYFLFQQDYRRALLIPTLIYFFLAISLGLTLDQRILEQLTALPGYYIFCIIVWFLRGSRSLKVARNGRKENK